MWLSLLRSHLIRYLNSIKHLVHDPRSKVNQATMPRATVPSAQTGRFINLLFQVATHTAHGMLAFSRPVQPNIISTTPASIQPQWLCRHDLYNLSSAGRHFWTKLWSLSLFHWSDESTVSLNTDALWDCLAHLWTGPSNMVLSFDNYARTQKSVCQLPTQHQQEHFNIHTLAWNQSNCTHVHLGIRGCLAITAENLYLF